MQFKNSEFRVIDISGCPKYRHTDVILAAGMSIQSRADASVPASVLTVSVRVPAERLQCNILNGDLARLISRYGNSDDLPDCVVNCSGCSGSIQLEHRTEPDQFSSSASTAFDFENDFSDVRQYKLFRTLAKSAVEEILEEFRVRTYSRNFLVLRPGDPSTKFFVILSGSVEVLSDTGLPIADLYAGEIFGESGILSENDSSALIRVQEDDTRLMYTSADDFRAMTSKYPETLAYISSRLAERVSRSNNARVAQQDSRPSGTLSEIPPGSLLQMMAVKTKTGILTIFSKGFPSRVTIRRGEIVRATSGPNGEFRGKEAIFEVLRLKDGRFTFTPGISEEDVTADSLGPVIPLIMEGMNTADNSNVDNIGKEV